MKHQLCLKLSLTAGSFQVQGTDHSECSQHVWRSLPTSQSYPSAASSPSDSCSDCVVQSQLRPNWDFASFQQVLAYSLCHTPSASQLGSPLPWVRTDLVCMITEEGYLPVTNCALLSVNASKHLIKELKDGLVLLAAGLGNDLVRNDLTVSKSFRQGRQHVCDWPLPAAYGTQQHCFGLEGGIRGINASLVCHVLLLLVSCTQGCCIWKAWLAINENCSVTACIGLERSCLSVD